MDILIKGAMSQFAHVEKFSLNFSSLSFVILSFFMVHYYLFGDFFPSVIYNLQISFKLKIIWLSSFKQWQTKSTLILSRFCIKYYCIKEGELMTLPVYDRSRLSQAGDRGSERVFSGSVFDQNTVRESGKWLISWRVPGFDCFLGSGTTRQNLGIARMRDLTQFPKLISLFTGLHLL